MNVMRVFEIPDSTGNPWLWVLLLLPALVLSGRSVF